MMIEKNKFLINTVINDEYCKNVEEICNKTIFDMRPSSNIENGAYDDKVWRLNDVRNSPTRKSFSPAYKSKSLRLLNQMINNDSVVVDIGCSNGEILHHVDSKNKIGIDICPNSMLNGSPNILDSDTDIFIIADGKKIPIKDNSVDVAICCDIIEHLLKPEELIAEVKRILKPGGIFFVTVPNLVHLGNRLSFLLGSGTGIEFAQIAKGKSPIIPISGPRFPDQRLHLRWFTSKSLSVFLNECGFQVKSRLGIGPIVSRLGLEKLTSNTALLTGVVAVYSE